MKRKDGKRCLSRGVGDKAEVAWKLLTNDDKDDRSQDGKGVSQHKKTIEKGVVS